MAETHPLAMELVQAIDQSVRTWKFRDRQADKFRLRVLFRQVDTFYEPGNPHDYTIYRVDEGFNRPPIQIVVEAHRQGTFADSIKR
jgi:hypothetical protein